MRLAAVVWKRHATPARVVSDKQIAQWAFAANSLRQQGSRWGSLEYYDCKPFTMDFASFSIISQMAGSICPLESGVRTSS